MSDKDKLAMCVGCTDNYYNGTGAAQCWALKKARPVTRYKIGHWTPPDRRGAFEKVTTLNCHREPGKYAFYERLPAFITAEERERIEAAR